MCIVKRKAFKPKLRSLALSMPYFWYVLIAPESVPDGLERLQSGLELIDGNIKYAMEQCTHLLMLALSYYSVGNINMCLHYCDRTAKMKTDSEALEDMKAQHFIRKMASNTKAGILDDIEQMNAEWDDLMSMKANSPIHAKITRNLGYNDIKISSFYTFKTWSV